MIRGLHAHDSYESGVAAVVKLTRIASDGPQAREHARRESTSAYEAARQQGGTYIILGGAMLWGIVTAVISGIRVIRGRGNQTPDD